MVHQGRVPVPCKLLYQLRGLLSYDSYAVPEPFPEGEAIYLVLLHLPVSLCQHHKLISLREQELKRLDRARDESNPCVLVRVEGSVAYLICSVEVFLSEWQVKLVADFKVDFLECGGEPLCGESHSLYALSIY